MSMPSRHALLLAGAASCWFLGAGTTPDTGLQAASTGAQPLQDSDGDGLHDLLENRLGTNPQSADSDGDLVSDLEEYTVGRDPLKAEPLVGELTEPHVRVNLYQAGGLVYLQGMVSHKDSIEHAWVGAIGVGYETWTTGASLLGYVQERRTVQTLLPSVRITTFTLAVPEAMVKALLPASLVLLVEADGVYAADQLRLVTLGLSAELMEVRDLQRGQDTGASGTPSGLFPASPTPSVPLELSTNEICVQQLAANGVLGAGRMVYTVSDAYCDFLAGAICLSDCRLSAGDTVVGVDIPGLLGSLND